MDVSRPQLRSGIIWSWMLIVLLALGCTADLGPSQGRGGARGTQDDGTHDEETQCSSEELLCGGVCRLVQVDPSHCGDCDLQCSTGQFCDQGVCSDDCGGTVCETPSLGSLCVDIESDSNHCGACGTECLEGQECVGGLCVIACPDTQTACDGGCVDTMSEAEHCGACGNRCASGQVCNQGACECSDDTEWCDDSCVDLQSDNGHCGACGVQCESYEACEEGACRYSVDSCGGDARDVNITQVFLYNALETELYREGALVPATDRTVPVIMEHEAMVRVFVEPQPAFVPRELSARLILETDGAVEVYHERRMVTGPSVQADLNSTFRVPVPAGAIRATTNFRVELVECGADEKTGDVGMTHIPNEPGSFAPMDALDTGTLRLAFVPVHHDWNPVEAIRDPATNQVTACVRDTSRVETIAPDMSKVDEFVRLAEMMLPASRIEWSINPEPYRPGLPLDQPYTEQVNEHGSGCVRVDMRSAVLTGLSAWRQSQVSDPRTYYVGIADPGVSPGGQAFLDTNASAGNARARVSINGPWAHTVVHELGHNFGREHVLCNGREVNGGSVDPNYPYPGGKVEVWGYNLDEQRLIPPGQAGEFMSYCGDEWISEYNYLAIAQRLVAIEQLPSADNLAGEAFTPWRRLLVEGARARWVEPTKELFSSSESSEQGVVYDAKGDAVAEVEVHRIRIADAAPSYLLYVPEPRPGWHAVGIPGGPIMTY